MLSGKINVLFAVLLAAIVQEYLCTHLGILEPNLFGYIQPPTLYDFLHHYLNYIVAPFGSSLGAALTYYWFGHAISTKSKIAQATTLSLLVILINGALRTVIFNIFNQFGTHALSQIAQVLYFLVFKYTTYFAMCMIIVTLMKPRTN